MKLYISSKDMLTCMQQVRAVMFSPRMVKVDHLAAATAIASGHVQVTDCAKIFRSSAPGLILASAGLRFSNDDPLPADGLVRALIALKMLGVHSGVAGVQARGDLSILANDVADMTVAQVGEGIAGGRRFKIMSNSAGQTVALTVPARASVAITAAARRLAG